MRLAAIAANYEAAIRYAAERSDSIHGSSRAHEPLGFDVPGTEITKEWPRAIASEKLYDLGREAEAEKTLWHEGDLVLDRGGKIRRGVFSTQPIEAAADHAQQHLEEWSGGRYAPVEFHFNIPGTEEDPLDDGFTRVHHRFGHDPDAGEEAWDLEPHQIADHVASQIDDAHSAQSEDWYPQDDSHVGLSQHDHQLLQNYFRQHGVPRGYSVLPDWGRYGEGTVAHAHAAAEYMQSIVSRLEESEPHYDPEDDEDGEGQREFDEHHEHLHDAKRLVDVFEALASDPERQWKEGRAEYQRRWRELRKTKPIVADPTDAD